VKYVGYSRTLRESRALIVVEQQRSVVHGDRTTTAVSSVSSYLRLNVELMFLEVSLVKELGQYELGRPQLHVPRCHGSACLSVCRSCTCHAATALSVCLSVCLSQLHVPRCHGSVCLSVCRSCTCHGLVMAATSHVVISTLRNSSRSRDELSRHALSARRSSSDQKLARTLPHIALHYILRYDTRC